MATAPVLETNDYVVADINLADFGRAEQGIDNTPAIAVKPLDFGRRNQRRSGGDGR